MSPQSPFQALDAARIATFGETVVYSRPGNSQLNALDPFDIQARIYTGGEFADPSGGIFADVLLQTSAIDQGPQKGDLMVISNLNIPTGTYKVQTVFLDKARGSAHLKVRWTGQ